MGAVTSTQADRILARTAGIVARMRADADAADRKGDHATAALWRGTADSRERATANVRVGQRIGQA